MTRSRSARQHAEAPEAAVRTSGGSQPATCPPPSFLSLSVRVLANVEAMNMVEAIGNVVRHRKASVIYRVGGRYELRTVPVVSGEALRHALQAALADVSSHMGLPVCDWCRRHEFIKHGVRPLLGNLAEELNKLAEKDLWEAERKVMEVCVVEDVGGFLVPIERPVKRTSVVEVGYMVPAVVEGRVLYGFDVQFHTRHAPVAQSKLGEGRAQEEQAQSVYNKEAASALYSLSINVELWRIGVAGSCEQVGDRGRRVRAALLALAQVLNGDVRIGGNWSSYKPAWTLEEAVAVFSKPLPISAMPAVSDGYIEETINSARSKAEVYKKAVNDVDYKILVLTKRDLNCGEQCERALDSSKFVKRLVELGLKYAGVAVS